MSLLNNKNLLNSENLLNSSDQSYKVVGEFHNGLTLGPDQIVGGPARLLISEYSNPFPLSIDEIIDENYYSLNGWKDLGATKSGIKITSQITKSERKIDPFTGALEEFPTQYQMKIDTQLAEININNLSLVNTLDYEVLIDGTEKILVGKNTKHLPFYRLAVLHRKENGLIRGHIFRKVYINQENTINYAKGEATLIPMTATALADYQTESINNRYGTIYNQLV